MSTLLRPLLLALLCLVCHAPLSAGEAEAQPEATDPLRSGDVFAGAKGWINTAEPITLEKLKGHVVLVDFWTYCCINCIHVIPDLKFLEEKYKDQPFVVIGVHSGKFDQEKNTENIRTAVKRYGIEHPVAVDNDFAIWQRFGSRAWPTLVLIDSAGQPVGSISGEGHRKILDQAIAKVLEKGRAEGTLAAKPLKFEPERHVAEGPLSFPGKVLADAAGKRLFIADTGHNRILEATPDGAVTRIIGSGRAGFDDGTVDQATFNEPQGMALSADGATLWVCDRLNHALRAVDLKAGSVRTLSGTGEQGRDRAYSGPAKGAALNSPWDVERVGSTLIIAMAGHHQIWRYDPATDTIHRHAGTGAESCLDGPLLESTFSQPSGLALDGDKVFIADSEDSTIRTVAVDPMGTVESIAGSEDLFGFGLKDGNGKDALFQHPLCVEVITGAKGRLIAVADTYNHVLRTLDPLTGDVATLAVGGLEPGFFEPSGLSSDGKLLYVADTNRHRIVALNHDGSGARVLSITLPAAK
jgi:sugar lactone lactonase YvrE/thiol-disulfide isomerase/thioredoxin